MHDLSSAGLTQHRSQRLACDRAAGQVQKLTQVFTDPLHEAPGISLKNQRGTVRLNVVDLMEAFAGALLQGPLERLLVDMIHCTAPVATYCCRRLGFL
jgi:hypothetical protein